VAKLDFVGQRANEKTLFVFRRHIIAMRKGFYGLLISFVLGSIPFLIWSSNVNLLWGSLIGFGVGLLVFFYHWLGWYFSVYIVTSERIHQITRKGLFKKTVIDLKLARVQNHSYNIPGFFGEIFGFGTIVLQTMVGDMVIHNVEHCEKTYSELIDAIHTAGGGQESEEENGQD